MKIIYTMIGILLLFLLITVSVIASSEIEIYEKAIAHVSNVLSSLVSLGAILTGVYALIKKKAISAYLYTILEARHFNTFVTPHLNRIEALIKGHELKKAWLTGAIAEIRSLRVHIDGKTYFSEKLKNHFDETIEYLESEHKGKRPDYNKSVIRIRETKSFVEESYYSPNIEVPNE